MTCPSLPGAFTPQSKLVRDIDRSDSPPSTKRTISLRRLSGRMKLYEGADVLISDCLQRRPHPTHAHLDAVLNWAKGLGVGRLYLTHMNNSMDYASLKRDLPDWAEPAFDGLEIEL